MLNDATLDECEARFVQLCERARQRRRRAVTINAYHRVNDAYYRTGVAHELRRWFDQLQLRVTEFEQALDRDDAMPEVKRQRSDILFSTQWRIREAVRHMKEGA